jgi:hypothetical protein
MKGTSARGSAFITRAPQKGGTGTGSFAVSRRAGPGRRRRPRAEAARVGLAQHALLVARLADALRLDRAEIALEVVAHHLVHQVQAVEGVARIDDLAAGIGLHAVLLDVVAGERRAAEHDGMSMPWRLISSRFSRITTVDFTSRPLMPMACALCSRAASTIC